MFNRRNKCLVVVLLGLSSVSAHSNEPKQAVEADKAVTKTANLSSGNQDGNLLEQFRAATRQADILKIYNQHISDQIKSQTEEKLSLEKQLKDIEVTQQEVLPLILRMLNSLDKFVQMDLPFLPEERQQRVKNLREMVVKMDISNAEKFRRIMEAFQIENEYGKTIEAYKANIQLNNISTAVDFLRLGRVALYYQRLDGSEAGFWNKEKKQWALLPSDYSSAIRQGLRVARKETAPDLLTLPVSAPEVAQ
jgi:Protein of unknown function (DUF3450)